MEGYLTNISIEGIKTVIPKKKVSNSEFASILGEKRCKKQIRLTGVTERYLCEDNQTSADLAYVAANRLLDELKWNREEVDVLIFATQNPLFVLPSSAFFLQNKLGIGKDCVVFDMNLGCSAAIIGIQTIASLLNGSTKAKKGILLVADPCYENHSENPDVVANQMLFGAAGTAVAITKADESGIMFQTKSDGNRYKAIIRNRGEECEMDGAAVFEFGVNDVAQDIKAFMEKNNLYDENVDYYSFHQAQALMLNTIDGECGIPSDKEIRSLDLYGNTNGSSVLVNLCANRERIAEKEYANILLAAFGVGLSWGMLYLTIKSANIFPVEFTDFHFAEE